MNDMAGRGDHDHNKWHAFAKKMAVKRDMNKKRKSLKDFRRDRTSVENDFITVQRLSASVAGKAQKFCRVGPREFVPYKKTDLTIEGIKEACNEHFKTKFGTGFFSDVLAGEQGPSCNSISQIPNPNLIHIRFLPVRSYPIDYNCAGVQSDKNYDDSLHHKNKRAKQSVATAYELYLSSEPLHKPTLVHSHLAIKNEIPKSISISQMLQLGKNISKEETTVNLFTFDIHVQSWSSKEVVKLSVDEQPFAEGGFCKAYKAVASCGKFKGQWVIKKYKTDTLECIKQLGQTPELQAKRCVQMNCLAQHFAAMFERSVQENELNSFGSTFKYNEVFMCELPSKEFATIEKYIHGNFEKHINNTGTVTGNQAIISQKASAFVHFSCEKSQRRLMVVDIQGCNYQLMDPEIATTTLKEDDEYLFCAGNLASFAIENFTRNHKCNEFCKGLNLPELES